MKTTLENKFRFTTMPIPSVDYADGKPYQYIGTTTTTEPIYTNGYFYKCVAQGTDPETYAWEEAKVQSDPTVNGIGSTNITDISVEQNSDFTIKNIIITYDDGFEIQPFASASWDNIAETLKRYYAGELSLNDIKQYYHEGDTKTIPVSAIASTLDLESQEACSLPFVIMDFNHDNLVTPINGKSKALLSVGATGTLPSGGRMFFVNQPYIYKDCARNEWFNTAFTNALPNGLQSILKTVDKGCRDGNAQCKVFLPALAEMIESVPSQYQSEGTRYSYYANNLASWIVGQWWGRTRLDWSVQSVHMYPRITYNNGTISYAYDAGDNHYLSLAPMFCL